jgi:hypothetical protein
MAGRKTRNTFGQRIAQVAKACVGLAAVAGLGYAMLAVLEHDGPILTLASGSARVTTVNPEPATSTSARNASVRAAAVRPTTTETAPARDFDYFPDHYRNQAKEPVEPVDTF